MKKRLLAVLVAAACLCSLTACGGGGTSAAPEGYSLSAVDAMAQGGAFSEELEALDADTAFMLYRLADYELPREALTDCSVLRSSGATCEEGAVLLFQTEDQAKEAKQALLDYLQGQIDANVDYRPAEIPKLEEARVSQVENTLLMVIAADLTAAEKAVPDLSEAQN